MKLLNGLCALCWAGLFVAYCFFGFTPDSFTIGFALMLGSLFFAENACK